ncbi:MAG: protein kinase, partial [bacterium]
MIGKKIRHYKILEKLGEGGMGIVYLAEDTKLDRRVAIKFLPRQFAANSEERKRFEVEAKAAAALNHPNIATIYAIEQTADEVFIVMEYIEGQTIQDKLTASGPLPAADCIDIAIQIAAGLQAAHDKGITHRDIKSANIMVTIRGDVKIMDFGLAKFGGSIQLTQTGSTVGTVAYMSPEQTRGGEVDHRSDIWAFGVVLYELLTGTLPFPGDYEQAVIYSILNEPPKLKKAAFTAVDPKIRDLVFKALEKEVSDRFQTMEEMLQILAAYKTQSSSKIAAVKDKKGIRRSPALLLAVATVIIVFAILGWNYYQQTRKEAWARNDILPKIDSLISLTPWTGEGNSTWEAYKLNNQIKDIMQADPYYQSVVSKFLVKNSFRTVPGQSKVFIQAYADTSENWVYLGESPIDSIPFPRGISKVRFEKAGYASGFDLIWNASFIEDTINFTLLPDNQIPSGMVFVPKDASRFNIKAAPANLHLPGLEMTQFVDCGDFYMDRFEVSNREFKEFVDAGGYSEPKYWKYPFVRDGKEISWQEAMAILVDQTGQPGPASWVVGDYPAGSADLPVNGVSWYEAVAYAEFRGKSLPTIFHWDRVAFTWASPNIVPLSNIAGTELKVVNDRQG